MPFDPVQGAEQNRYPGTELFRACAFSTVRTPDMTDTGRVIATNWKSWRVTAVTRVQDRVPQWSRFFDGCIWMVVVVGEIFAVQADVSGLLSTFFVAAALVMLYLSWRDWIVFPLTLAAYAVALACDEEGRLVIVLGAVVFLGVRYGASWRTMLTPGAALCGALYVGWAKGGAIDAGYANYIAGTVWSMVEFSVIGAALAVAVNALQDRFSLQRETSVLRGRTEASERHTQWLAERTALARELHDVVGHHVTAMVVQSEAGQVGDPQAALRSVADLGRSALGELDALVVHLRDPSASLDTSAPPRLSDIDDVLADPLRRQGVTVRTQIAVDLALDDPDTLTLYRVAQEALTNIVRHADARNAWVDLTRSGRTVRLRVSDDGVGPPAPGDHGSGLLGVQERVTGRGGICAVSERPGGGTSVDVFIPVDTDA